MRKFGSFVRELQLEFAPVDGYLSPLQHGMEAVESDPQFAKDAMVTYLDQVLCVLGSLRNNRYMDLVTVCMYWNYKSFLPALLCLHLTSTSSHKQTLRIT